MSYTLSALPPANPTPEPGRTPYILVVDDEPFFAEVALEMLLRAGYLATFALGSKAALSALVDKPEIDLLFTDVVMPGADGFALATEARRIRPGLPILFSSVHVDLARGLVAAGDASAPIVEKPYRQDVLIEAVRQALGSDRPGLPQSGA